MGGLQHGGLVKTCFDTVDLVLVLSQENNNEANKSRECKSANDATDVCASVGC